MEQVTFYRFSGDTGKSYSAVKIITDYEVDKDIFTDINFNEIEIIKAKYRIFKIDFGLLTASLLDYLRELDQYNTIIFERNSTQYNVRVIKLKDDLENGYIELKEKDPMP